MVPRLVEPHLRRRLAAAPAAAVLGPRQSGKTTLARALGGHYFDLEQDADRLRLDLAWDTLTAGPAFVVLDEAQAAPRIFSRLRGAIDRDRKRNGRFLLLGSVSPTLIAEVSQSLAGRLALIELSPLLWSELPSSAARGRSWLCGGFPDGGVLKPGPFPDWQRDYLSLLVQRDLPAWGLPARPQTTDRLVRMLAALQGQIWNASQIGQSLGLSYHTINSYVDYLAGAFLVRRLQPFQANLKKRLVKSPRIYWRDTGLLHAVLGITSEDALLVQPWVGASWEGYVIEQIVGTLAATGMAFEPYYFRTSDGYELDLVIDTGPGRWAIEIKLTTAPSPDDMARLDRAADLVRATRRFLVTRTARPAGTDHRASCDLAWLLDRLARLT